MSGVNDALMEDVKYIRDVFPSKGVFDRLVEQGAYGDEMHTITGDDLAGACWALNNLMEHFGVE